MNGTHLLLVCADDVNLLGININITKKDTETLLNVCKEVGLEVNADRTKFLFTSRHQTIGQGVPFNKQPISNHVLRYKN
jgi:hypothetical protein